LFARTPGKRLTMFFISRVCFTARSFEKLLASHSYINNE
jgi:hypothetical protein